MKPGALADAAATVQEGLLRDNVLFRLRTMAWRLDTATLAQIRESVPRDPNYGEDPTASSHPDHIRYRVRVMLLPAHDMLENCTSYGARRRARA